MTFLPYIIATFIFRIPANILTCYFGANLKTISNILTGQPVPAAQVVYQLGGLFVSITVVVVGVIYARRAMKQIEDEQRGLQIVIATDLLLVGREGPIPRSTSMLSDVSITSTSWAVGRSPLSKQDSEIAGTASGATSKPFLPLLKLQGLLMGYGHGNAEKGQVGTNLLASDSISTSMGGSECSGAMSSLAGFSETRPFTDLDMQYFRVSPSQQAQQQQSSLTQLQQQQLQEVMQQQTHIEQQPQMLAHQLTTRSLPHQDLRTDSILRGTRPLLASTSQNLGTNSTAASHSGPLPPSQDLRTNSARLGTRGLLSSQKQLAVLVMSEDVEWQEEMEPQHSPSFVNGGLPSPGHASPRSVVSDQQCKVSARHSNSDCEGSNPSLADLDLCHGNWGTCRTPRVRSELPAISFDTEPDPCDSNRSSCSDTPHPVFEAGEPQACAAFASPGKSYGILNPLFATSPRPVTPQISPRPLNPTPKETSQQSAANPRLRSGHLSQPPVSTSPRPQIVHEPPQMRF